MKSKRYMELRKKFSQAGWTLKKQKRFYGLGYYAIEKGKEEYQDWKWVGSSLESVSQSIIMVIFDEV